MIPVMLCSEHLNHLQVQGLIRYFPHLTQSQLDLIGEVVYLAGWATYEENECLLVYREIGTGDYFKAVSGHSSIIGTYERFLPEKVPEQIAREAIREMSSYLD